MANIIKLGGLSVDADDPCAMKSVLEVIRLKLISGEQVEEMSIQSPVTREDVKFSPGKLDALNEEIARLTDACLRKCGKRVPGRRWRMRY